MSLALLCALGLLGGPDTRATTAGIALAGLLLSLVVAVVLLGVQLVLIKAFCKLCLLTYAVNALAFMIVLPTRRSGAALGSGMRYSEGRVALAGWGLGTVALAAAVLAFDTALASRATAGSGPSPSLLGVSAPPSSSPAPAGSEAQRYQEEARVAQEQARRLQEILDDPKKLADYFGEKARQEYEQGPVLSFNLKGAPFKGPADAPIRVVEFSDFLCPYCRQIAAAFASYVPQSGEPRRPLLQELPAGAVVQPQRLRARFTRGPATWRWARCARRTRASSGRTTTASSPARPRTRASPR